MTTTIELTLPWGLYHATPWDRSANEGAVEWPPSPWRLLRALYAAWRSNAPELSADAVAGVLDALAIPPRYALPAFSIGHARHYFPGISHRQGGRDTTKTFDTFVSTDRDAVLLVEWPVELSGDQRATLNELVTSFGYVGRSESLVDARLLDEPVERSDWIDVDNKVADPPTRLLAPELPLDLAALIRSPAQVRAARMARPPGTRWLRYSSAFPAHQRPVRRQRRPLTCTAVRFAITSNAPPPMQAVVALGDLLRKAALRQFDQDRTGRRSATLAGKDTAGHKRLGPHLHAHYVALSHHGGRRLDTMVVWAPGSIDESELLALTQCRQLSVPREVNIEGVSGRRLLLGVEGFGRVEEVASELVGPSIVWASSTPYIPTRHRKGPLRDQLREDVVAELAHRDLPAPIDVDLCRGDWLSFRRHRVGESVRDAPRAFGLRIRFAEPVTGPLALGRLSHFGLGLFLPEGAA